MAYILLIVGVVLVLWGADRLTEGASSVAKRLNISDMVIGLTVVYFGTSMPELVVSLFSAFNGSSELAIGNVVGSNIFNSLFIVGCTAMVFPIVVQKRTLKRDIPFAILASFVLLVLCSTTILDGTQQNIITRSSGIILLCFFAIFMVYTFATAHQTDTDDESGKVVIIPMWKSTLFIVLGLLGLVFGGKIFVNEASAIARSWGVSESVIGLTIVAMGTSLPELATSVVAAYKKNAAMAIGNVLGSNLFNIFFILGTSATVTPLAMGGITQLDMYVLFGSSLLIWAVCFGDYKIRRFEGALLTGLYLAYTAYLVIQAV